MKTYNGGSSVKGGYYWNTAKWEVCPVRGEVGLLPGDNAQSFVKVSIPMLLVLAPAIGGAYAFFLPFIGFAMAAWAVGRKVGLFGSKAMGEVAITLTPAWRPGEAYLAGKPDESKGPATISGHPELDQLSAEVEAKKSSGEKDA